MFADIISTGGIGKGATRQSHPASQIVIRDTFGNPLVVAFTAGTQIIVSKAGEKDFASMLARLGEPPPDIHNLRS